MIQLYEVATGFVVLEFNEKEEVEIYNSSLKIEMERMGVLIPNICRKQFDERERIRAGESGFLKAFKEVYYPLKMDPTKYLWRE